jgi:hypothetical protein
LTSAAPGSPLRQARLADAINDDSDGRKKPATAGATWEGSGVSSTRISQRINAPRAHVYRALLDARAIAKWKVPDGMRCHVQEFDARQGGALLSYDAPTGTGKTTPRMDTYHAAS